LHLKQSFKSITPVGLPPKEAMFCRGISDNHARSACIAPFLHRRGYITEGYVCDVWAIDYPLLTSPSLHNRRLCMRCQGNASIASKFCKAKQSFALQNLTSPKAMLRLIDCLRLYKEGNALPPTGVIDLKLRFKCIKNKVFDRLKTAGF